jgi:transposase-like protein
VLEHLPEYPSVTAAAEVVARREGLDKETVRRWVVQAQMDGGQRQGAFPRRWRRQKHWNRMRRQGAPIGGKHRNAHRPGPTLTGQAGPVCVGAPHR